MSLLPHPKFLFSSKLSCLKTSWRVNFDTNQKETSNGNKELHVNKNSNKTEATDNGYVRTRLHPRDGAQSEQNPEHAGGRASHGEGHEHCLTFLLSNEGMATPLERLRSDTSTFRMFWIYRRRKKRGKRNGSEKDREKTSIQGSRGTSLVQLVRTTHLSPAALGTPRAPSGRLWWQLHPPEQAAANCCSKLHSNSTYTTQLLPQHCQVWSDCPENQRRGRWQMIWEKGWETHILWRLLVIGGGSRRSAAFFSFAFFLSSCSGSRAVLLLIFLQLWTEEEKSEVQTEYAFYNPKNHSKSNFTGKNTDQGVRTREWIHEFISLGEKQESK